MTTRTWKVMATVAALITGLFGTAANAATNLVVNLGDANTFICDLTATNLNVTIVTTNGSTLVTNTVHAEVYKDENAAGWPVGAGIPIPIMNLTSGQMVICRFKNKISPGACGCLDEGTSIHWHGIELDNDSDGTGVTQDSVLYGQSYTYRYKVARPGLFWFHSHMMPGNTTFAGMYGAIIVPNSNEGALMPSILPTAAYTYTLAMSDIEFDAAGNVGRTNITLGLFRTINQWVEDYCGQTGAQSTNECTSASKPGAVVLVNGEHPLAKTGAETPKFLVPKSKRIRLRLLNEAVTRNFRLRLLDAAGNQIKLYRVGGQGGLLDKVRLEGGIKTNAGECCDTGWDTKYILGEVNIGSGDRVDVIALTPTNASPGQILRLVGNPLPSPFELSKDLLGGLPNIPSNYPVAFFQINGLTGGETEPTTNELLLAGIGTPLESIKDPAPVNPLTSPPPPLLGTVNPVITLNQAGSRPAVDGIRAGQLDGNTGNGDWLTIPYTNNTRYARVGDLLELSVDNTTNPSHPFHLHGFSMQPVKIVDTETTNTLFTYDYNEFVDTIDVYGGQTLVFRVRIDDREKFCDEAPSATATNGPVLKPCIDSNCEGALGRWLFHCHIFAHAGLGMINELVVLENIEKTNQVKVTKQPDLTPTGVDVLATAGTGSQMVADDFQCTTNGPITHISIWGSWNDDFVDTNATFELKFWSDVPGSPSTPGVQLWRRVFPPGTYSNSFVNSGSETFYDPSQPSLPNSDTLVFRYDFKISECDAFYQSYGNIYWLSVTAYTTNGWVFGWKTCITNDQWGDDATWSPLTNSPTSWTDLHYPSGPPIFHPYTNSMDMAFELGTGVPTNCTPPVASFSGSPTSGTVPLPVTFTDISTGNITNRFWDFGDGSTINITTNSVSHTYTTAGVYSVTLIVSGPCGNSTNMQSNYITASCTPPTANFAGAPTNGLAPLTVGFTAFPAGAVTNWFWNFGDGSTTNIATTSIMHTYTIAGTYSVTLTVSDPCSSSTITKTNYITACAVPVANFTGSPTNGTAPLMVLFVDASTGTITNRFWSFGDTGTSSLANPSHTYSNAGVYSVSLTVFGPCGMAFTNRPNYITVLTPAGPSYATWQTNYFPGGGPNSLPNADPDGDGMINTNEFLAGFNPTNNAAYLRIISIVKSNNDIKITYLGANGDNTWSPGIASRTNVLEFTRGTVIFGSNIMATGSYSNNFTSTGQTNILSGGNGSGLVTNFVETGGATNIPSRYYRIRVLVP